MPTNDRLSLTAARAWLRVQVDRFQRSVMSRRPAVRWGLALVVLLSLAPPVYWAAMSLNTVGVRYLVAGRQFSSDDLIKVCTALDKQRLNYRVDDARRVEVAADQFDQAAELVAKIDLGQHPIREIRDDTSLVSIFDPLEEREHKRQIAREKIIEGLIGQLDGVVSSLVSINRGPQSSKWQHASANPKAFVYIETEGNRQLPYQTAQSISGYLTGYVPDLAPGSITVMDRRGFRYFDSGNLAVGDNSRNRAREEELGDEILEKLDWIKGVRVQVKVISPRTDEPVGPLLSSATRESGAPEHAAANPSSGSTHESYPGGKVPEMSLNHPLEQEPETQSVAKPMPPPAAAALGANATAPNPPATGQPAGHEHQKKQEPGHVLIYVPRSFYINASDIRPDNREPTVGELHVMAERTENQIKTIVGLATPSSESWKVDIITLPDEVALNRPVNLQSTVDARRRVLDWGIVGTVVAVVSILAAVGSWIQVARRPVPLTAPALSTGRFHVDSASEPGPSERVRELVRRDPQAAASVLQRWTGQGRRF